MPEATVLAFDFGEKRIGIAVGETLLGSARALETLNATDNAARFARIAALVAEWQPARLLVGRPAHDDGSDNAMTARCERFARQLQGRFGLPVETVDERYSSTAAEETLSQPEPSGRRHSWRARKERLDAEAARVILQSWMDTHGYPTSLSRGA